VLCEIDFHLKKFADGFKPVAFVETSYLNIDTCKFESSQKNESRTQSANASKVYRKPRAFSQRCSGIGTPYPHQI